jgi:hypothetical protein
MERGKDKQKMTDEEGGRGRYKQKEWCERKRGPVQIDNK